ncbi:hypothetical protein AAFF_G00254160 [Aldrovandia affinis]|uniref:Uncharacterized protein n=1 Tax=Aldrovandia affinis TaxID=143900 RepID=A0AAD7RCU8_9TELE|nr:hypothetical protein AAFF_G00254160 [Aldrovandia affinis]
MMKAMIISFSALCERLGEESASSQKDIETLQGKKSKLERLLVPKGSALSLQAAGHALSPAVVNRELLEDQDSQGAVGHDSQGSSVLRPVFAYPHLLEEDSLSLSPTVQHTTFSTAAVWIRVPPSTHPACPLSDSLHQGGNAEQRLKTSAGTGNGGAGSDKPDCLTA